MLDIALDMQQVADEVVGDSEQETGIYKTPTSVKLKPKQPRAPRIYKPREPKEPKQPKPNKPVKSPRKPPKSKNQTPKPHRDIVVRVPSDPNISKITGKPKRKYTRKPKQEQPQKLEQQETSPPVQEEILVAEPQLESCLEREPTYTLNFHHVSPSYLYQLAKHRTFKLVTKQEQGEYVPAQVNEHGVTIIPSYIAAGCTVPAGQCSKCRANASPRIPIYYSTFETSDGWPLPYLCDRCYEIVRLWKWNAEFCEPLPMVLHYGDVVMHEHLHCKGLEA